MEPATLLFVEVFGMIGIAAFLTQAVVRDRPVFAGPARPGTAIDTTPVAVSIFCPDWKASANATLGGRSTERGDQLAVLSCDMLLDGETCSGLCLQPALEA
jgi:hypothetical protein